MDDSDQFPETESLSGDSARPDAGDIPPQIDRYRIERLLGQGGFGRVYLARDAQLERHVAIKVPHAHLIAESDDADAYLAEARTVVSLEHPNVVPVHDVGSTDEFPCYIVSKFIEGESLAAFIKESGLPHVETARLVATVAEALHFAHKRGVVHRDIKPGNILIGTDGSPFIVDFGLALREQDLGTERRHAGTPHYMSPEQARGEGHRVDGRSDIFSLGVVLYELLVGRRPFQGNTRAELLKQLTSHDPRPPRQIDDGIPKELERICLKSLSKRATERYTTSLDMAEDLRHFLERVPKSVAPPAAAATGPETGQALAETQVGCETPPATPNSDGQPIRIVPKGLRAFDEHDADFFLELLPGPRDRDGLPESIRSWKTRIEETDADKTFSVGLVYGPSGCGKSSLVRAGLLPRLADHIKTVYMQSAGEDTETLLLRRLRSRSVGLPDGLDLKETIAALRRGQGVPADGKVLIILDQFEQWLHTKRDDEDNELVQALRQCDGGNVQCIVMVRDDFWMAATRFMRALEVRLIEAHNSAAVDLFPIGHAQTVLGAFGRSFGALSYNECEIDQDGRDFLKQSAMAIADDGKVICVRLALFAEMLKGEPWTPAILKEVGGIEGIGVAFLYETFSAVTAAPEHRFHQKAARAVLKSLLPEAGTDIKAQMRHRVELCEASGYSEQSSDFDALLQVLDHETRLITPVDPEECPFNEEQLTEKGGISNAKYYQLTHDYLVPSLREWLTREQRETLRGRLELLLAERSALWHAKPETQQLPSVWEYAKIRALTANKNWTESQRRMMRKAGRFHMFRSSTLLILFTLSVCGFEANAYFRAKSLVNHLLIATEDDVMDIVRSIEPYRRWAKPRLAAVLANGGATNAQRRQQLHARMALADEDKHQIEPLMESLLTEKVTYVGPIAEAISSCRSEVAGDLWRVLHDDTLPIARRFRAGVALATLASDSERWTSDDHRLLAEQLVSANPEHQASIRECLRPISEDLILDLERLSGEPGVWEQLGSANALGEFAGHDGSYLARLLPRATPAQYAILYPLLDEVSHDPAAIQSLREVANEQPTGGLSRLERLSLGKRRAGAAITLLRQGASEDAFAVFRVLDDPESLTQFVHRCRERGVGLRDLLTCLDRVEDLRREKAGVNLRLENRLLFGLLLALGEFQLNELPEVERMALVQKLADWYAKDPSSAIHGATGWLLRHWGCEEESRKVDQTPVPYAPEREWFTMRIEPEKELKETGNGSSKQTLHLTFIVFPTGEYLVGSPASEPGRLPDDPTGEYLVGSPASEPGRLTDEIPHQVGITRVFAILDREITRGEYEAFDPTFTGHEEQCVSLGHTMAGPSWYDAVKFCRWLTQQAGISEEDQAYLDPKSLDAQEFPPDSAPLAGGAPRNWPVRLHCPGFRLPTDAEWEIACRGGMQSAYGFGHDVRLADQYAWFADNSNMEVHMPRLLRPNFRGLFDMHGNVNEWCHDWLGEFTSDRLIDPSGPADGSYRIFRGGDWDSGIEQVRSAFRLRWIPSEQITNLGFRVVLVLPDKST